MEKEDTSSAATRHTAFRLACEPIDTVGVGFIGLGYRGMKTLERYLHLRHVRIAALCDTINRYVDEAASKVAAQQGQEPPVYRGPEGWKSVCQANDVDLVFICTDWMSHADMACHAMECGKHVALEVPAAMTVDDCWRLVLTAETTRRHCMMTENCCYDAYNLMALQMIKRGLLGDITHAEGAYIHNMGASYNCFPWMKKYDAAHVGNFYPTHGLGPICIQMGIHRDDRLAWLVSLSSDIRKGDLPRINTTIIKTVRGRTITLTYDVATPRPYSRIQMLCGTKGFIRKYPVPTLMLDGYVGPLTGTALEAVLPTYEHPFTTALGAQARKDGVPGDMNYIMDRRLIHCLRHGEPLDMDVYDAAEWSCITELSERSVRGGSVPVAIPRFDP
jgi:predicted dehydrogenase